MLGVLTQQACRYARCWPARTLDRTPEEQTGTLAVIELSCILDLNLCVFVSMRLGQGVWLFKQYVGE